MIPTIPTFQQYASELKAQGYDEVIERDWAPDTVVDTHEHDFTAKALVVRGEMWLTKGQHTEHIPAGGTFELNARQPHSERYGKNGATYWVARRKSP
ncbi:MAG: hypothetical protein WB440_21980 [Steroidobacteraceae bacterium]|jgi:hypothetical protein